MLCKQKRNKTETKDNKLYGKPPKKRKAGGIPRASSFSRQDNLPICLLFVKFIIHAFLPKSIKDTMIRVSSM